MNKNHPMLDLEDCEVTNVSENKTSSETLIKAKGTKFKNIQNNHSGFKEPEAIASTGNKSIKAILAFIVAPLLCSGLAYWLGWN